MAAVEEGAATVAGAATAEGVAAAAMAEEAATAGGVAAAMEEAAGATMVGGVHGIKSGSEWCHQMCGSSLFSSRECYWQLGGWVGDVH